MFKKVLFVFTLVLFAMSAFAQNDAYTNLLNKARICQEQKEFAYALGYYYDAMEARLEDCDDAYDGYKKLADAIEQGNPGFEEYSNFDLHNEWRKLLQNAEKYWTEFPYWGVEVDSLQLGANNSLTARVRVFETEKNKALRDLLIKGLDNTFASNDYKIDSSDEEKSWPEYSLFADKTIKMLMLLKVRLDVCDLSGKVLVKGQDFMLDSTKKKKIESKTESEYYSYINYVWENVPASVLSADLAEMQVSPAAYVMEYKVFDKAGEVDKAKSTVNKFPLGNSEFQFAGKAKKESVVLVIEKRNADEAARLKREKYYVSEFGFETKEQLLAKIIEDNRLTKEYTGVFGSNYIETICNGLSEIFGYKFVYVSETGEMNLQNNGFVCRPSNETEEFCQGGQALQPNMYFYIHSMDPQVEEKIQASIQRKIEERAKLLEERIPVMRNDVLKFIEKTKTNKEGIVKKFRTEVFTLEYIEARVDELVEAGLIEADKKGKYILTKEGKEQLK